MAKTYTPARCWYKTTIAFSALIIIIIIGAWSCRPSKSDEATAGEATLYAEKPLLRLLAPAECGIAFENRIVETYENNITTNINIYNGGGVAAGDFNNDGLVDLYFICSNGKNRLYQNIGGLKFKDITDSAGVGSEEGFETAVTVVDINGDGWLDLYVCRGGTEKSDVRRNRLYVNNGIDANGQLTFTERAREYGLDDMSACTGANFFDFDNDGDLDVYLLNYPTEGVYTNKVEARLGDDGKYHPLLHPRSTYDSDRFYRNDTPKGGGPVRFTDISQQAGIWNLGYGLSVSTTDINRDGWIDVYVGNDFVQPDQLYINNRNGTFSDHIRDYFQHSSQHTMGTDLTDFDNDGLVDLVTADMLAANNYRRKTLLGTGSQSSYTILIQNGYFEPVVRNTLQRNNGNGTFSDIGCLAGIYQTDWSWSTLLFDMDNDGLRDLYITNGYRREVTDRDFRDFHMPEIAKATAGRPLREVFPDFEAFMNLLPSYKVRNFCFQNRGDWTFADKGGQWMTIPASWSCGAAWADLDNDGDLDLVVNNLEQPAFVYENLASKNANSHYLQIKLQGNAPNTQAVGTSVAIYYSNGQVQYAENFPTRGIFSSVEHLIHFGLGNTERIDRLVVRWPDGKTQTLTDVRTNQRLVLKQSDAAGYIPHIQPQLSNPPLLVPAPQNAGVRFVHKENEYNDFEAWPMNVWKVTELGPMLAVGDVNGDNLEDFFIGNAFDHPAALYLQQANGTFRPTSTDVWEQDKIYEDHGALFFDADMDGDLDLFVVSGGAEATSGQAFQNRLYINVDGKGSFVHARGAVPLSSNAGSRAVAYDYDRDGDLDLFIGGRVEPGKWPLTPRSMVWRNERTHFADVTAQVAPDFERCGMVSDLQWADIDGDSVPELIAVGEWMPVIVFKWKNGQLQNVAAQFNLANTNGLWFRLATADVDGDGDLDLITGNLGLNTRLTASDKSPLRCFAKDFDQNGTLDPFVAYYEDGKLYPLLQKDVVHKHCPVLKKKFLYAKDYAKATMDMLWPNLDESLQLYCYILETCWWENQGGRFTRRLLPLQAQVSPVQGIVAEDFNGDGILDLLLAGNKYGFEYETNRCDAGTGVLLLGNGKGEFRWSGTAAAGFLASREARDLALVRGANRRKCVVVANNNGPAEVFLPASPLPRLN